MDKQSKIEILEEIGSLKICMKSNEYWKNEQILLMNLKKIQKKRLDNISSSKMLYEKFTI